MSSVYLCGPITGLSYNQARYGWRKDFSDQLDKSITVLSPMRHEGHLAEVRKIKKGSYDGNVFSSSKGIRAKDKLDVQMADVVVACFLGAKEFSIGSVMEIGWADWAGKQILLIMEDKGNIHDRFFMADAAAFRVSDVSEAAAICNSLLSIGI